MLAEYIRDMHKNYMVIKGMEGHCNGYKVKILLNNDINGVLKAELRYIDQMDLFYYDITGKITLYVKYEKGPIHYDELKSLIDNILQIVAKSEEFLLSEDDFVIDPNYIYYEADSNTYELCYLPDYRQDFRGQLESLFEFLMNKIDYKDEEAVVLIYALYKEVKEINCTYDKLTKMLQDKHKKKSQRIKTDLFDEEENDENKMNAEDKKKSEDKKAEVDNKRGKLLKEREKQTLQEKKNLGKKNLEKQSLKYFNKGKISKKKEAERKIGINIKQNMEKGIIANTNNRLKIQESIASLLSFKKEKGTNENERKYQKPFVEEIRSEKEVYYYHPVIYLMAGGSVMLGILCFILALYFKLLHNTFGNRLDMIKVLSYLIIIVLVEVYIMVKLFDKKNRNTKTVTDIEYMESDGSQNNNMTELGLLKESLSNINYGEDLKDWSKNIISNISIGDKKENSCYISKVNETDESTRLLWISEEEEEYTKILCTIMPEKEPVYEIHTIADGSVIKVESFPFIIGKSNTVNLQIKSPSVSRFHAKITLEEKEAFITDLGSTNGTYLNKIKLLEHKPYLIGLEDELLFADVGYIWRVI
ncbi:MAG: hypothetical protein K0R21_1581 [Anaerocolumna sp.]|jgi:hypothetical protein|nr:hypothetical protein [Anaerocolumna sp.]